MVGSVSNLMGPSKNSFYNRRPSFESGVFTLNTKNLGHKFESYCNGKLHNGIEYDRQKSKLKKFSQQNNSIVGNKEWRKVLYKHQDVPDNFVPNTFLQDLRTNVNLTRFDLTEIIIASSLVTQQLAFITLTIIMFIYLNCFENRYDSKLFTIIAIITIILYLIIILRSKFQELIQIKTCLVFFMICFTMSPVLRTLTETISTDTIYAQCTIMVMIHLSFHDYGINAAIVSRPVSLNAIFFASVCLASRLPSTYHAFAFLIFSSDLFVLLSLIYKSLHKSQRLLITAISILITLVLIQSTFGYLTFFCSIVTLLFINLFCPYLFHRMQSLKENIYGPWDEAILDQTALNFSNQKQAVLSKANHNHSIDGSLEITKQSKVKQ
ncbi:cytochrome c oxidase subunit Va [Sarcoptes scabiei]|nr:cytochrome c oxidase subunit Va [Sarcoptes scabiei]